MNLDAVLLLGQKLVKEYELEKTNDTLSKWMVNYLAELLIKCNEGIATSEEKKECCDVILQFWKNKNEVFTHRSPLKKTDELISSLDRIYNPVPYQNGEELDDWLKIVNKVDCVSKSIQQLVVYRSLAEVIDHDNEWMKVKLQLELDDDMESKLISKLKKVKQDFEARSGNSYEELTINMEELNNIFQKVNTEK